MVAKLESLWQRASGPRGPWQAYIMNGFWKRPRRCCPFLTSGCTRCEVLRPGWWRRLVTPTPNDRRLQPAITCISTNTPDSLCLEHKVIFDTPGSNPAPGSPVGFESYSSSLARVKSSSAKATHCWGACSGMLGRLLACLTA